MPKTSVIREAVVFALGPIYAPDSIYTLEDLGLKDYPRTSSGKVRKVDLQKLLRERSAIVERAVNMDGNTDIGAVLIRVWSRTLGIDESALNDTSSIEDFADSLTVLRLRNNIARETGVNVDATDLMNVTTIAGQRELLMSRSVKPMSPVIATPARSSPPEIDDILPAMGDYATFCCIKEQASKAIEPLGFTWQDDVEDVLPSWDLGHVMFGSVSGSSMVNFRSTLAMKTATVQQLRQALYSTIRNHAMQRSFEVQGVGEGAPLRLIMRPNDKWFQYAVREISSPVHDIEELTALLDDGTYFDTNAYPFPAFQIRLAHLEASNTAGLIWSAEHSAL
jgi:acyl carrier protein